MAEIEKTPTLGLNKPPKGYFDWDVPLNENWDKLDFLGAGQLPLLATHEFDHRLEGDEAIGWAMQGSSIDGDKYTSVWDKLKTAKDRAVQQTLEIKSVTYTIFKDATSGWVFLDQANYNKAFTNLQDSLGFILTDVDGVKTIVLPKREVYTKPSMSDANVFGAESLPNHTHNVPNIPTGQSDAGRDQFAGGNNDVNFKTVTSGGVNSSIVYKDGAKVNPDHHTVFIYYKVGNTIVNQDQIDLGTINEEIDNLTTQMNSKANTDLSNVSASAKVSISGYGMPDYSRASTIGTGTYTAETDIVLSWDGFKTGWRVAVNIGGKIVAGGGNNRGDNSIGGGSNCFIAKGTTYYVEVTNMALYKCPTKGV